MSVLQKKLTELIARDFGIAPEEVTPAYIHRWREENIYPSPNYDFNGKYGGYHYAGLEVLSPSEVKEIVRISEEFLARFAAA